MSRPVVVQRFDGEQARRASAARQGKNRVKGLGHPTTSEMDYTPAEMEFMRAVQDFKTSTGRAFPTLCDYLRIFTGLGYAKPMKVTDFAIPLVGPPVA